MSPASLVPSLDVDVHLVLCDFGRSGLAYVETDPTKADATTIVRNLLQGQYERPVRVVALNADEGWARDVSENIAAKIREVAQRDQSCRKPRNHRSRHGGGRGRAASKNPTGRRAGSPFHWRNRRDIRRPPRATNPYSAAWRHCDAGFVEGIEDGDSQIRACATTFVPSDLYLRAHRLTV